MSEPTYIDRPPRIQPPIPQGEFEIPAPPSLAEHDRARLVQIGLPVISFLGFALASAFGASGRSPLMMLPMAVAVVVSTWYALYSFRKQGRQRAELARAYRASLVELGRELHGYHDTQRRAYRYNYPDPYAALRIVRGTRLAAQAAERPLRPEARLWERRPCDDDFGLLRIGLAALPSSVTYTCRAQAGAPEALAREALKLAADSRFVADLPFAVALRPPPERDTAGAPAPDAPAYAPPVAHALGIAGERQAAYELARAALSHYVVFHAPSDARLFVLATSRREWGWAAELPHCRGDEQSRQLCFVDEIRDDEQSPDDEGGELEQFLEAMRKTLAQRKIRLQERDGDEAGADPTQPFLLLVVDLLDLPAGESPLRTIEADPALAILLAEGAQLGAAVIFLVPDRGRIPGGCQAAVEVERTAPATSSRDEPARRLHFRFAEVGVNSSRAVGVADALSRPQAMQWLARELTGLRVRQTAGAGLAASVPFLDLMGVTSLGDLRVQAWRSWEASDQPAGANWLRVRLGLMSGNKPRTLVLSARRDGVHGVVAGSTGSGKSELLVSLIMGLAVNYHPTALNFVLVDYKGGSAFNEFKGRLPHCVDVITNLGPDGVSRMFAAVQAELERRQALNARTGTKNIVEYRQKGLHLTHEPYPFLVFIIDEFAEMIAARAEYKAQLETITRVGRAQGVSLILAAQRPSGVTDQMRSNIKLRICLRVETPAESRELLRRTDAAYLPAGVPGRGYLQVGNEELELVQVAYTGGPYIDPAQARAAATARGSRQAVHDQEPPELYVATIGMLQQLAHERGVRPQRSPWPQALPPRLWLTQRLVAADGGEALTAAEYLHGADLITLGAPAGPELSLNPAVTQWLAGACPWRDALDWRQYALRPVVGLVDHPQLARQLPLAIDLQRGHCLIVGGPGYGKTTLIRTMVASLAATHSPGQLHAYLLDLGGRQLEVLRDLPHVGALILPDEEGYKERVAQLMRELEAIAEARKTLLAGARVATIAEYNQLNQGAPEPGIVVAIDNFVAFAEAFGGAEEGDGPLDRLVALARQSRAYGIHFVIAVQQLGELPGQLFNLFTERLALRLADPADYRTLVGEQVPDPPDLPGRGYLRLDRRPLSFQAALFASPEQELASLEAFVGAVRGHLAAGHSYRLPVRVDAMPKGVLLKQLIAREHGLRLDESFLGGLGAAVKAAWAASKSAAGADWLTATLGVVAGGRPRALALEAKRDGVHGLVAGGTGAGKSELLMTLIVSLTMRYDPSVLNFLLVDYKGGGAFKPFARLPHVIDVVTNLNRSAVKRVFTTINAELQRRQRLNAETGTKDIVEYRARGLHLTREPYPHLFIIIDEFAELISASPEFSGELESITRVGRAQGVHLLLAAQRPIGVTDQMRANIKLRICLRVEGADTSRELLRRSDAALLPSGMPGRGYLQVGGEGIELIQVAYTGETYPYAEAAEGGEQPKFYDVAVRLMRALWKAAPPPAPWPPPLRGAMTFADPFAARYFPPAYGPLVTMGRTERLAPNPFVGDWLEGKGAWPGVDWSTTAMRAVVGAVDDPYSASQLPLVIDFTRGHAVLFGASGWGKTTFVRSLVASLASTHSPGELHVHVLDLGGRNLEALGALPHVGTVIMPDEQGYEERVQQLWRALNEAVDRRKRLFSEAGAATLVEYNRGRPDQPEAAILVAIDNFTEYVESFGAGARANDQDSLLEAFVALARLGKAYGVHFLITTSRLNTLSSKLYSLFTERLTLRLADPSEYSAVVGAHVPELDELPGRGYARVGKLPLLFQVALLPGAVGAGGQIGSEARLVRAMGAQMGEQIARSGASYPGPLRIDALPTSVSYRQLLAQELGCGQGGGSYLAGLKGAMERAWRRSEAAEHADWLAVPLGIASGNRARTLRLEARLDGAHGMIAGGTGSGKSELLMTMIAGLAAGVSPDIVNFVLVDYKGGGAFKPFERLPHVVDSVTNLNKAAVNRMFTAINAEIRRRQALNAETGTKDIVEYRRRGLHLTREPYPHLFIIIDEFAEMVDDNPEHRLTLDSITRVGRAQGVNLILASQQPKGVSDQMRANIKLRICLRVEQADTSRELLRRPDAAMLPGGLPGRGYLQVGGEGLELIQVAFSGERQPDDRDPPALWPDRPAPADRRAADETPRLFNAVVAMAGELYGGKMAPRPWPSFLPDSFTLESPLADAQGGARHSPEPAVTDWVNGDTAGIWPGVDWLGGARPAGRPVVGLLDRPAEARQEPLRLDLTRGHTAVFGDAGLGKSTFLRTMLVSLAATHSPAELHAYVLDLGGRSFRSLEELPHVGAVIYADEESFEERLQRLLELLERTVAERQQLVGAAGVASLYEYNARFPDRALPMIVVAIDNIAELHENHEALVESTLLPLVRGALSAGVTFVVSANVPGNIPGKLYNLLGERITFRQSNADRYLEIVGRGVVEIGDAPGRAYLRRDQRPLLAQIALPAGAPGPDGRPLAPEAEELRAIAQHMGAYLAATGSPAARPEPIATLAESVDLEALLGQTGPPAARSAQAVLGQDGRLRTALIDLRRMGPHFAVAGPPLSGKTTALWSWVLSVAERHDPAQAAFVLVDTQGRLFDYGGERSLAELPHVIATASELEQLEALLPHLRADAEAMVASGPGRQLFVVCDNFDELSEELEANPQGRVLLRELAALARRYGRDGLHFIIAGTLDGTANELRKRVQSCGYGLGLRTEQGLAALRVQRLPAALRDHELPVGRGFVVKSGQCALLQVAAPYAGAVQAPAGDAETDDGARAAAALDGWVERLRAKYPGQERRWSGAGGAPAGQAAPARPSPKLARMLAVLRRGASQELAQLHAGNGHGPLLGEALLDLGPDAWQSEALVVPLMRKLWASQQARKGLPPDTVELLLGSMNADSLLLALERALPADEAPAH